MQFKKICLVATLTALGGVSHAGFVMYTDLAAFNAAAGLTTIETFDGATLGVSTANYSGVFNGFTLTSLGNGDLTGIANGAIAVPIANSLPNAPFPAQFAGQNFYGWGDFGGYGGTPERGGPPESKFGLTGANKTAVGFDYFNTDVSDAYSAWINYTPTSSDAVHMAILPATSVARTGFVGFVATDGDVINSLDLRYAGSGGYISTVGLDNVRVSAAVVDVPEAVPEPASLALIAIGLTAMAAVRRRRRV
jgi:hypothetical protein